MNTYKYPAHRIPFTNTGTVTVEAGSVWVAGDMIGIVVADTAASAEGVLEIDGVHVLPAVNNDAFVQGEQLYWDDSANKLEASSTGNEKAGRAAAAKATAATTCLIILNSNA